jgi:hypothetical protein
MHDIKFKANERWFDKFKKQYSQQNLKNIGKSALGDHKARGRYPKELGKFI